MPVFSAGSRRAASPQARVLGLDVPAGQQPRARGPVLDGEDAVVGADEGGAGGGVAAELLARGDRVTGLLDGLSER
ncbi:hypothetical protein [Streptomyces sp. NPDC049590]|uniref:hypothetical protein n=1 Tax=Streptomyces sp. NPDC049590 TaxID=3154834 RepID=UPI003439DD27